MKAELKNINSEVVKLFSDFMIAIMEFTDLEDYRNKKALRSFILDLIAAGKFEIIAFSQLKENGEWRSSPLSTRILNNIEWVKSNLDVWDVRELEAEQMPYDDTLYDRRFMFDRKDL
jgi:hypothetical protein